MPLNSSAWASDIWDFAHVAFKLNADGSVNENGTVDLSTFNDDFGNAFNDYLSAGIAIYVDVNSGDPSLVTNSMPSDLAQGLDDYFCGLTQTPASMTTGVMAPLVPGTVKGLFETELQNSITDTLVIPYYSSLTSAFETVIKAIKWNVVLIAGGTTTDSIS